MAIAKTASRNVAFKVARMREAIMEDQDELITRKWDSEDVASESSQQQGYLGVGGYRIQRRLVYRQSRGQYSNLDF